MYIHYQRNTHPVRMKARGRLGFSCCAFLASSAAPVGRRGRCCSYTHTLTQDYCIDIDYGQETGVNTF